VNAIQRFIEFYEMVSLNDAALRGSEKTDILKARLALRIFERVIESLKAIRSKLDQAATQMFKKYPVKRPLLAV
jgi:hypothetical protein